MKFKNTKQKKTYKKTKVKPFKKSPSNYRIIPEKLNADITIFLVGLFSILLAIVLISLDIYANFGKQTKLTNKKFKVLREVSYWENEIRIHPGYRDAYMSLALLNFQLKNFTESRNDLNKVLEIDPNFEKGRELENLLDSF